VSALINMSLSAGPKGPIPSLCLLVRLHRRQEYSRWNCRNTPTGLLGSGLKIVKLLTSSIGQSSGCTTSAKRPHI
jgi:hypothetical protein